MCKVLHGLGLVDHFFWRSYIYIQNSDWTLSISVFLSLSCTSFKNTWFTIWSKLTQFDFKLIHFSPELFHFLQTQFEVRTEARQQRPLQTTHFYNFCLIDTWTLMLLWHTTDLSSWLPRTLVLLTWPLRGFNCSNSLLICSRCFSSFTALLFCSLSGSVSRSSSLLTSSGSIQMLSHLPERVL